MTASSGVCPAGAGADAGAGLDAGAGAGALAAGAGDRLAAPDGADATLTDFEVCQARCRAG
jgi:hypothetical protein